MKLLPETTKLSPRQIFDLNATKAKEIINSTTIILAQQLSNSEKIKNLKTQLAEQILFVLEMDAVESENRFFPIATKLLHHRMHKSPEQWDRVWFGWLAWSIRHTRKKILEDFRCFMDIDNAILNTISKNPIPAIWIFEWNKDDLNDFESFISVLLPIKLQKKYPWLISYFQILYDLNIWSSSKHIKLIKKDENTGEKEYEYKTNFDNVVQILLMESLYREFEINYMRFLELEEETNEPNLSRTFSNYDSYVEGSVKRLQDIKNRIQQKLDLIWDQFNYEFMHTKDIWNSKQKDQSIN